MSDLEINTPRKSKYKQYKTTFNIKLVQSRETLLEVKSYPP